ncbi:MAG TPA: O-antigen ligase family protein, partial [Polyangiales bacterium]|nr:O-antigen ligase family protein [Polyangiales bacterium]
MSELRSDVRFRSGRVRKKRRASSKTPLFASQHAPLLKVALGLFAVHIVGAPMLLGGVHAWAIVTIAISACLCLIAAAVAARARLSDTAPIVVWVAVGLLAWTALQVLPLPCSLVSMLAPDAVATLRADRAMLGLSSPTTCRLTLDPGGTQEEVLKGVAIVASLLAAWLLARAKAHREVLWMVAASSLVMSAVALVHGLGRMDEVFGLYTPQRAGRQLLLAPLMNQNNLGAFAAMGVPLWIALTHRVRSPGVRWLGLAAVITTVATALLSLSRGAIAQLLVSLLLVLWVVQVSPRRSSGRPLAQRLLRPLATVLAIAIAGAGVLYAASDRLASELENRDLSKLGLIRRAFQLALDHLWVGIGRGAFASAFVHLEGASARFGYAENFVVQWLSEWGAPITLLWLAVAARALYDAARGSESLARKGALIALFGLVLQNLVDLGFEVLGMAVVAAALFAAIVASARPEPNPVSTPRSLYAPTFLVLGGAIAALLLIAPHIGAQSVSELDAKLRQQMHADDRPGFRATL